MGFLGQRMLANRFQKALQRYAGGNIVGAAPRAVIIRVYCQFEQIALPYGAVRFIKIYVLYSSQYCDILGQTTTT